MARLDGKVAVITGGGSGIGRAGALLFAREGAAIVVIDTLAERIEETTESIGALGGRAIGITVDVRDAEGMVSAASATIDHFGSIDILWNNAGIGRGVGQPIEDISLVDWRDVMAVNLDGVFHGLRAVLPHMKARRRGAVLMTSSIMALRAYAPGGAPYTASKGAIAALTRLLALELAAFDIRVNCIAPGPVRTSIAVGIEVPEGDAFELGWTVQAPAAMTDAVRWPEPDEIAQTALYLVDDAVGPMTGAVLAHDGGITAF